MKKKLSGVMPALVTPFDAKGEIDFKAFETLLTMLRGAGVTGWVPCGSTGEYSFLSDDERDAVLTFVKDFAKPGETLIAGTNAPHTKGVIANTKRAKEIGYDTVLLAVPFYTKPSQAGDDHAFQGGAGRGGRQHRALQLSRPRMAWRSASRCSMRWRTIRASSASRKAPACCSGRSRSSRATRGGCSWSRVRTMRRSTSCSGARTAGSAGRPTAWPRPAATSTAPSARAT